MVLLIYLRVFGGVVVVVLCCRLLLVMVELIIIFFCLSLMTSYLLRLFDNREQGRFVNIFRLRTPFEKIGRLVAHMLLRFV